MNHITAIQTLYSVGIGLLYHSVFRGKTGYKDKVDGKEATPKMKFKAYSLLLINLSFQIYILLMIPILFEGLSIYLTTALGTLILLVPLACYNCLASLTYEALQSQTDEQYFGFYKPKKYKMWLSFWVMVCFLIFSIVRWTYAV